MIHLKDALDTSECLKLDYLIIKYLKKSLKLLNSTGECLKRIAELLFLHPGTGATGDFRLSTSGVLVGRAITHQLNQSSSAKRMEQFEAV